MLFLDHVLAVALAAAGSTNAAIDRSNLPSEGAAADQPLDALDHEEFFRQLQTLLAVPQVNKISNDNAIRILGDNGSGQTVSVTFWEWRDIDPSAFQPINVYQLRIQYVDLEKIRRDHDKDGNHTSYMIDIYDTEISSQEFQEAKKSLFDQAFFSQPLLRGNFKACDDAIGYFVQAKIETHTNLVYRQACHESDDEELIDTSAQVEIASRRFPALNNVLEGLKHSKKRSLE